MDFDAIKRDQEALRARWRTEGYYTGQTLSQAIGSGARAFPLGRSIFYRDSEAHVRTNATLFQEGLRLAAALRKLGIKPGDVVAVQLPTWLETAMVYQAIAHVGAVTLPIVSIYGETEVRYILRQSGAKLLFLPATWRKTDYAPLAAKYLEASALRHVVMIGDGAASCGMTLAELVAMGEGEFEPIPVDPDEVCCLIYTSGTTSAPKGVMHSHNTLLHEWGRPTFANRGTYLSSLPAGHITGYGYLLRTAIFGAPQVFVDRWEPLFAATLIERHRIESAGGTPTFLLTLLDAADKHGIDISSLTSFSMGGQGVTPAQVRMADDRGFRGARVYGSTEHPTVTRFDPEESFEHRAYTDGRIDGGNELRIVDDEDRDVLPGAEGNILSRGPDMFSGYLDLEANLQAFAPGGWFRTGDIGRLVEGDYLIITDRKKDIIIRGGENISSVEIEALVDQHPAVAMSAAVAMPDKIYGEKVCAFVVLRPGCSLTLEEVRTHFMAANVAIQKTPERLEIVTELPRNATGKIKKHELRASFRAALDVG
jgi:acyl-coenzyme A synthetase/AMP-(fatty) acid ligase